MVASTILLDAIQFCPKAPAALPLCISSGHRNALAPRYGQRVLEIDPLLLALLCGIDTVAFVQELSVVVPSLSELRPTLARVAARCHYIETLSLKLFASARREVEVEDFAPLRDMARLCALRVETVKVFAFRIIAEVAPPPLREFTIGSLSSSNSAAVARIDQQLAGLPRGPHGAEPAAVEGQPWSCRGAEC
jgi:hypothetical protein